MRFLRKKLEKVAIDDAKVVVVKGEDMRQSTCTVCARKVLHGYAAPEVRDADQHSLEPGAETS